MALGKVIQRIEIEMSGGTKQYMVSAKQGDRATRYVETVLLNHGEPYTIPAGSSVTAFIRKPDRHRVYTPCEFTDNVVMVELDSQALAAAGTALCEVEVKSSDLMQVVTSVTFEIEIEAKVKDEDAIVSGDELSIFDKTMKQYADQETKRVKAEEARVQAETGRVKAEEARVQAETGRVNAEKSRVSAESDRVTAEQERQKQANEVLDIDVKKLCFEENEDINITEYTQAAMVTASVAILKKIEEMGLKPDLTAGLSLGEYCALVASDVMSFEDAVKVVRQRGILMQDTVPAGEGAMSAVLGMKKEAIEAVLPDVEGIVTIANYNCPGQIVISGESKAVAEAGEALKEAGAKRVLPLKVSGPFHSPMLKPAGEKLLDVLADVEVDDPTVPYVSNTTAELITSNDQVKELLGRQVYSSVCWEQSIEKMIADGADTFVEIGPGRTLCGFMRKIDRNVKAINIAKVEDLEKLKEIM